MGFAVYTYILCFIMHDFDCHLALNRKFIVKVKKPFNTENNNNNKNNIKVVLLLFSLKLCSH